MRTGAAAGHDGYFHEAVYYSSDDELLAVVVPFLTGGAAAGEPTLVALGERNAALVRSALPAGIAVEYATGDDMYARPAAAIRSYRNRLARYVAGGARQIRIIGELPAPAFGATWEAWARYESAINHAYDEWPLWSMCAYDRRSTSAEKLHEVARTHPRTACPDGTHPASEPYTEPVTYLSESRPMRPDPLQASAPFAQLTGPTPTLARQVVREANAIRGALGTDELEDLVVAVSEAVTNARVHGRAPVSVRVWPGPDRLVVTVTDAGPGPKDPFAGLLPAEDNATGGRGLWITHQSVNHATSERTPDGWTLRLTAGNPD